MSLPLKAKDKATGRLNAGINASVLSIPLQSGNGANFPQPYTASCTSLGTSSTLNSTGIGATGVAVNDYIHNVTDDSWAVILSVSTHSVTTTKLKGGTLNLWSNSDVWRVNEFIVTVAAIDSSGNDTSYEEVLISNRSTDTLTVPTGGRGYNSTVAQSFLAGDYVQLRVTTPYYEEMKKMLRHVTQQVDTNKDDIASNTASIATGATNITNLQTGAYHYVVATGSANAFVAATPALGAYAAGNEVYFKANFGITGTTTLNVNGLGAKTIKKLDGATNLASGDIANGQLVHVRYDGTNFQLLSPVANSGAVTHYVTVIWKGGTSSTTQTNPTSNTAFDTHVGAVPSGFLIAGTGVRFSAGGIIVRGTTTTVTVTLMLGSTAVVTLAFASAGSGTTGFFVEGVISGQAAAGGSVNVKGYGFGGNETTSIANNNSPGPSVATNGALNAQFGASFGTSNGSNTIVISSSTIELVASTPF